MLRSNQIDPQHIDRSSLMKHLRVRSSSRRSAPARISQQLSAPADDAQHPAVLSHLGVLNVLLGTLPRPSDRKSSWVQHLVRLATKSSEKCGLVLTATALVFLGAAVQAPAATPVGTAFTYQGQLAFGGGPADGVFDLVFDLYDDAVAGAHIGSTVSLEDVVVSNGLLMVELDFGEAFFGDSMWLEIGVRDGASTGAHTVLSPRQPLSPSPFASWARAASWDGLADVPPGFADDVDDDIIGGLSCADGEIAVQGAGGVWQCGTAGVGDITGVAAGFGITGGGDSGDVSLAVNYAGSGFSALASRSDHDHQGQHWSGSQALIVTSDASDGLAGSSQSPGGSGVKGIYTYGLATGYGVSGITFTTGVGVYGHDFLGFDNPTTGVLGEVESTSGTAVRGLATATSGTTYAIVGETASPDGYSGFFLGGSNYFEGPVGIGDDTPQTKLHIRQEDLDLPSSPFGTDDVVIESTEAVLGLYSTAGNTRGSGIGLGEVNGTGGMEDMWNIARLASDASTGPDLRFSYGPNATEGGNTTYFVLGSNGRVGIRQTSPQATLEVLAPAAEDGFRVRIDGGTKLLVKQNGYVAIGGNFTPSYQLEVGGDGTAGKPGGGSWSASSDRRLKKNIHDLDGALDLLTALRGVTFEYIDPDSINELPGTRVGMIAQEVEEVMPDWVSTGPTGYKRLTYRGFEALTVEAFRELKAEKDALEQRVSELEVLVRQILTKGVE